MQIVRSAEVWSRLAGAALAAAIGCSGVAVSSVAVAQGAVSGVAVPTLRHGLQDMRFIGPLGTEDETNPPDDVLTFSDGQLSSKICLQYGFAPAPYWVRRDADGLHFRAELHSPASGTIRFDGVFDGEQLRARALWTKKRWYWTVEQRLVFTGRPAGSRH